MEELVVVFGEMLEELGVDPGYIPTTLSSEWSMEELDAYLATFAPQQERAELKAAAVSDGLAVGGEASLRQ